jgi:hypothetical protein
MNDAEIIAELARRNVDDIEALAVLHWIDPAPMRHEEWVTEFWRGARLFLQTKNREGEPSEA